MNSAPGADGDYDVVIIGGALAGASAALLLSRERPALRILVVEKSSSLGRRVGEATVEVSAYFLGRVLGLTQYLNESHLVKQGMRFWSFNDRTASIADCSEVGGGYLARVPAYQVDRSTLDAEVLRRAEESGARILCPASVVRVDLVSGGKQTVVVRVGEEVREIRTRWVIDASGLAAILARQEGWWRRNEEHPTAAVWSRWTGVKDMDGRELAERYPRWAMACHGIRATATNHLTGDGWWAWIIPLKGGDVSVGVVFDQRLVRWPEGGSLGQRLKDFLLEHPVGNALLSDAQWREGDIHWRRNLAYSSTRMSGDGFALVGDASAFLDPFYSPGMDWISFTVFSTVQLILRERRGEPVAALAEQQNKTFVDSYRRWFTAIYRDKYEYLGEYDLLRLAFLLDLGFYYLGVASQPFKRGQDALLQPVFTTKPSVPFYHLMRTYNRRFARMARERRRRGCLGRRNQGRRFMFGGYTFAPSSSLPILKALCGWAWLECQEGWRSWLPRSSKHEPVAHAISPVPTAVQE
jgi:flavin-dependent dehydrogenase